MKQLLTGLFVATGIAFAGQHVSAENWTAYTSNPSANALSNKNFIEMAKQISEATGGEVTISVNLSGSLGIKESDATQALGQGVLQLIDGGWFITAVPAAGILRLPMMFNSLEEFETAMEIITPYIEEGLAEQNIVFLAQYAYPPQVAWSTFDMTSPDDMKGRKMRVSSPEQGAFVEAFGGAPVNLGGSEVATALQTGIVDGVFTASLGGGMIWRDQLKSNYRIGVNYFNNAYLVNKDAFDALSPENQKILRDLAVSWAQKNTEQLAASEDDMTAQLQAGGITVHEATPEDVARATELMRSYWTQWASDKDDRTKEALAKTMAALGL